MMKKKIKIICTLGPASYKKKIILSLKKLGVSIFRINLSHTSINNLPKIIKFLKKIKLKNICIDTEGAQIRTLKVNKKIFFKKNQIVKIFNKKVLNSNKKIAFYPNFQFSQIRLNSKIFVGFDDLKFLIIKKKTDHLVAKVISSGYLDSNKGVHFTSKLSLPPLTAKDIKAVKIAKKFNIKYFAMSFVNNSNDVKEIRKLIGNDFLISKIETLNALKNLKNISKTSDALLIDRGDLSRYISIEKIPIIQEDISIFAKSKNKPLYVATNLLETMVKDNLPSRAESHDIYSTLKQGVSGLVLAAETAIGKDPVNCAKFLKNCIKVFNNKQK